MLVVIGRCPSGLIQKGCGCAVFYNSGNFSDVTLCSLIGDYLRFGGTCCLHLQDIGFFCPEDGGRRSVNSYCFIS
jgi:hypothetical protein